MLEGVKAMVLGMGTVFVFLVVMVFFMGIMSKFLAPFAGFLEKKEIAPAKKKSPASSKQLSDADKLLAKAAIAAVHMHRGEAK